MPVCLNDWVVQVQLTGGVHDWVIQVHLTGGVEGLVTKYWNNGMVSSMRVMDWSLQTTMSGLLSVVATSCGKE